MQRLSAARAYKVRMGDYRVLLDIDSDDEVVYVLSIAHRRSAYG